MKSDKTIRILFVCHGNICRSAMAEYILKDKVKKLGLEDRFEISSAGTSSEELGNPMYPPARSVLARHGITDVKAHHARQMNLSMYQDSDYVFLMDYWNLRNAKRMTGNDPDGKLRMLIDGEIEDPWYTDNFDKVYEQINNGCDALIEELTGRQL